MKTIVTIDGVVCSGKGTVAASVARELGFLHMSSGEIYRAIGYGAYQQWGEDSAHYTSEELSVLLEEMDFQVFVSENRVHYLVDGVDVTESLTQESCARAASWVAKVAVVRARALEIQQRIGGQRDLVIDGRDCGIVVFPQALVKVFLTAEVETRARRRTEQLQRKGVAAIYEEVLEDLQNRDDLDMHRALDPLRPAPDAVIIDTTHRTLEDEVAEIVGLVRERSV